MSHKNYWTAVIVTAGAGLALLAAGTAYPMTQGPLAVSGSVLVSGALISSVLLATKS